MRDGTGQKNRGGGGVTKREKKNFSLLYRTEIGLLD